MLKIRRSQGRLIISMDISILVRRHLYIETDPFLRQKQEILIFIFKMTIPVTSHRLMLWFIIGMSKCQKPYILKWCMRFYLERKLSRVCFKAANWSHVIFSSRNCNLVTFMFYLCYLSYHLSFHFENVAVLSRVFCWYELYKKLYVVTHCPLTVCMEFSENLFKANFGDWWLWYLLRNCLRWMIVPYWLYFYDTLFMRSLECYYRVYSNNINTSREPINSSSLKSLYYSIFT